MTDAIAFLHALAQTLSANTLYTPGHPATRRSLENLWHAAAALLAVDAHPVFLFLGTAPVYAGRALHELRDWHHSARLSAVGVQRLEFDAAVTVDSLGALVDRLAARLAGSPGTDDGAAIPGVVFGAVAVQTMVEMPELVAGDAVEAEFAVQLDLVDELDAMQFVWSEAARGAVARAEADTVVRILATLVEHDHLAQAKQPVDAARAHLVHPVDTALLAMRVAGSAGMIDAARHRLGVAALLHNIGLAMLPAELVSAEAAIESERVLLETHTTKGAGLLLRHGGPALELAAVVAFEHHLRPDGKGYPGRRFDVSPHWASRLVGCCSAFAAARASVPTGTPAETVWRQIEAGVGTAFDPEVAALVAAAVRAA